MLKIFCCLAQFLQALWKKQIELSSEDLSFPGSTPFAVTLKEQANLLNLKFFFSVKQDHIPHPKGRISSLKALCSCSALLKYVFMQFHVSAHILRRYGISKLYLSSEK